MREFLIKLRQHLLSGVSFAIPFIACGGILIATAIACAPIGPKGPDFAGHPTLGSAHAWARHARSSEDRLVQECSIGLIDLRRTADGWAFAAPPLLRSGAPTQAERAAAAEALHLGADEVLDAAWVDNGPGWLGIRLTDAAAVLALRPDFASMPFPIGVLGPHPQGGPATYEVRAFVPELGVPEDPVTGSLNAGLAVWLFASGLETTGYTVRQGTAVGASGHVVIERDGDEIWVAGACSTVLEGTARF